MAKIGKKKNFALESQENETQQNDKLLIMNKKTEGGITSIDLILEPEKFEQLGSECRLTFEEYCDTINQFIEDEEADWHELRMKDMINMGRDYVIEATMLKYAKEHYQLDRKDFNGSDLNYIKRYDTKGRFLGEAVYITLTAVAQMQMVVR